MSRHSVRVPQHVWWGVDISRAVDRYHAKLVGKVPFVDFATLLPSDIRGAA